MGQNKNQIYYQLQFKNKSEKIKTYVPNILRYLNLIRKLKEGGPKCNLNI